MLVWVPPSSEELLGLLAKKVIDKKTAFGLKDTTCCGGLVLIGKAAVLKTAGFCPWGFESLILRQYIECSQSWGEVTELAEGARLLSVCRSKAYRGFESLPLRQKALMGSRQAVRQRVLVPPSGGSNPPCPASLTGWQASGRASLAQTCFQIDFCWVVAKR